MVPMSELTICPLAESDLDEADRVFRLAFGTFLGLDDPVEDYPDVDLVRTRWRKNSDTVFGAYLGDRLIGSNVVTRWGSVAFFGPTTVHPGWWDRGVGSRLMEPVMELFDRWDADHEGLFTFAQSGKHLGLYEKFGFWPRRLTAIMGRAVSDGGAEDGTWRALSEIREAERDGLVEACRRVTDAVQPGLDVTREIQAVLDQDLGDVVLVGGERLEAFGVCHLGAGTEAGSGRLYIKFGAVRPGPRDRQHLDALLAACEALATRRGQEAIVCGIDLAREAAYRVARDRGYRIDTQGVTMHRPNEPAYGGTDPLVIYDWR